MLPRACYWRWCPVRLSVRRGLVAVSASVNFQPPRGDRQHKKKSAGRAARCRPRSLLIATCPPTRPPARRAKGDPAIRGPGIRACGATVSAAEPAWARGIGRGRASGAGRTAHSRRTNRRPAGACATCECEASGAGAAARHMQAGGRRVMERGNWLQSRLRLTSHARFVSTRRIIAAAAAAAVGGAVWVHRRGVASLGFFFFFLYYSELYCEGSPMAMALMQIFRLCVVSFFFPSHAHAYSTCIRIRAGLAF